jgi:hypothetical protein
MTFGQVGEIIIVLVDEIALAAKDPFMNIWSNRADRTMTQ